MKVFDYYRQKRQTRHKTEVEETAKRLFQLQECDGEIWLTYGENLVCPCSMLKEDAVTSLKKIRERYIERRD